MQHFDIGKTTVTVDPAHQTITFDHRDAITGRKSNSPWVVPAGAVEHVEFEPRKMLGKAHLRLFLRDRAGYNPGIGIDMNAVLGGKKEEDTIAALRDAVQPLVAAATPVARGPEMSKPHQGAVIAPPTAIQFGDLMVDDTTIWSDGQAVALGKAKAEIMDADAARSRMTATRVAAGAVLAGPIGALVGGLAKKSTGRVYVLVTTNDGRVLSGEGPSKESGKAAEIAARINAA